MQEKEKVTLGAEAMLKKVESKVDTLASQQAELSVLVKEQVTTSTQERKTGISFQDYLNKDHVCLYC